MKVKLTWLRYTGNGKMLKKRIIPCLDVRDGQVVKGVQFKNHEVVGDILDLAVRYCESGADELVFYAIAASCVENNTDRLWVRQVASKINIPFCVAGGIRSIADAEEVLENGADKISINSPALENPQIIEAFAKRFGSQCVVIGIDSFLQDNEYGVYQYTGIENKATMTKRTMLEWAMEVVDRGAGEIVLNCMNQDGVKNGYDIVQTKLLSSNVNIPVVASGGAGTMQHFADLFNNTRATGALAASVFHKNMMTIPALKKYLATNGLEVRI